VRPALDKVGPELGLSGEPRSRDDAGTKEGASLVRGTELEVMPWIAFMNCYSGDARKSELIEVSIGWITD
jgi:hypothetical protein